MGVAFENTFVAGDAVNGTLSASWSSNVFAPSAVTSLNVYWGFGDYAPAIESIENGVFLGSGSVTVVPEPSSSLLGLIRALNPCLSP